MNRLTHAQTMKALEPRPVAYARNWDLSTIPDDVWASEHGRRNRAKAPDATNIKLQPCIHCTELLTARERRKACPHCGKRQNK